MSKQTPKKSKVLSKSGASGPSFEMPGFLQKHPHAVYISVLALLLIIFFHQAFFSGKVFNVPDNVSAIQYEQGYLEKAKQDGVNAFWNPYIFSGMPTWGSSSPGHGMYMHTFLDPFQPMLLLQIYGWAQAIVNIFPLPTGFWDIFNYFLLGLFTYLFGVRRKMEPFVAFLAAVSVVFTLYSLNWLMAGHNTKITVFAWLPALFLLVDRLFEKKSILTIAFLVAVFHFTFNAGHIQMVFYNLFAIALYILYKLYEGEKVTNVLFVSGILVFSAAFAFLMLSGPYFSTWEYKDFSIRGAGSGGSGHANTTGGLDFDYATLWSFSPMEVITFFVPSFVGFGSPTYWGSMPFTESPVYLGVVMCFLALLGILLRPRDKFVHFWVLLGFVALLISFGRNFDILYSIFFKYMPFFNNFRIPSMILYLMALCVAMLAAVGLSEIIALVRAKGKSGAEVQKKITKAVWIPVGVAVLFFLGLLVGGSSMKTTIAESMKENQKQSWNLVQQVEQAAQQGQMSQVPKEYQNATVNGIYTMAVDDAMLAVFFMLITGLIVWAFAKGKINYVVLQGALLLLVLIDLWIVDSKPMNMVAKSVQQQSIEKTDAVQFLEKDRSTYRILPFGTHSGDNYYVMYAIQSIAGYHPAKMKYYDDIRNTIFGQFQFQSADQIDGSNWPLLCMLNTKYLVVPSGLPLRSPWLKGVFSGQSEDVLENEYVLPRAFFVGRHEVIEPDSLMFTTISTVPGYQPDRVAYLSKPLTRALPDVPDTVISKARTTVKSYGINGFTIDVETPAEAILKLSEIYYPSGWTATIDGKEADILRTDYALRALVVPAGKHTVEMRFEPRTYRAGLIITTVTNYILTAILLLYAALWLRKRFGKKTSQA